ncbi:lytic transglycosylase domain-containing protein [Paraburkholderia phosphatilytica]|uniref:lytic transglycosylase domain-containing protein n=1 Tax=Paraburkholderia phosphatilytica TaxID=2282883 RepID=UPI000E508BA3|nr:lytic transglycosylase domain-containing protein [Paraburkholderia phosphatilytica]
MMPAAFLLLAQQCAPDVAPGTMAAIVRVESSFNPWAIGVVHAHLVRQPANLAQARATARALDAAGWNYSAGLAQVNRSNWSRLGLSERTVFESCRNLAAGATILRECLARATSSDAHARVQAALRGALSCYAGGNFTAGYRTAYVQKVVAAATQRLPVVPEIQPLTGSIPVVADEAEEKPAGLPGQPGGEDASPRGRMLRPDSGLSERSQKPQGRPDSAVVF